MNARLPDTRLDTVIIGGGQAGLALGHHLKRAGRRFVIVEAADRLGDSWRRRWDSLTLFTPRRYDALPGLPFPGDPEGYPGRIRGCTCQYSTIRGRRSTTTASRMCPGWSSSASRGSATGAPPWWVGSDATPECSRITSSSGFRQPGAPPGALFVFRS